MSKKNAKKKDGDAGQENAEQDYMLICQKKLLEKDIYNEQYRADQAMAMVRKHRARIEEIDKEFEKEKVELETIREDLDKQYSQMKQDLEKDIHKLTATVQEKEAIIQQKDNEIMESKARFEKLDAEKKQEISNNKLKLEDMSNEFARMLRETLDKMQERIEFAQWDSDADNQALTKIKTLGGLNN